MGARIYGLYQHKFREIRPNFVSPILASQTRMKVHTGRGEIQPQLSDFREYKFAKREQFFHSFNSDYNSIHRSLRIPFHVFPAEVCRDFVRSPRRFVFSFYIYPSITTNNNNMTAIFRVLFLSLYYSVLCGH